MDNKVDKLEDMQVEYIQHHKVEQHINHRDIKLENILIFKNNIFTLYDFRETKQKAESNVRKTVRGTDFYMSPLLNEGLIRNENIVQHNSYKAPQPPSGCRSRPTGVLWADG